MNRRYTLTPSSLRSIDWPHRVTGLLLVGPIATIVSGLLLYASHPETFEMRVDSHGVPIVDQAPGSGVVNSPDHYQSFCNQLRATNQPTPELAARAREWLTGPYANVCAKFS